MKSMSEFNWWLSNTTWSKLCWSYDFDAGNRALLNDFEAIDDFFPSQLGKKENANKNPNFEIKLDTNTGELWFGDCDGQLRKVASNLLDVVYKPIRGGFDFYGVENEGFLFCCSLFTRSNSLTIVECENIVY